MEEPSVLDYLKAKLNPRNWSKTETLLSPSPEDLSEEPREKKPSRLVSLPWRLLLALGFALIAQRFLEPAASNYKFALVLYAAALGLLILAILKKEWIIQEMPLGESASMELGVRRVPFFAFMPLALIAFLALNKNTFTSINLFFWISAILVAVIAFWVPQHKLDAKGSFHKIGDYLRKPFINLHLSAWNLLVITVFSVAAFFHLSQLASVPLDMTSDHAEKIMDITNVLNGKYSIFFSNNGGREPIQFYITTAMVKWFGADLNFTTLKLGMALAFLLGLFYVYKLGKELGNRWTGLLTMLFAGFAAWPNIIARVGLRLVLCPVFVAPVMYYLIRGFRRSNRNDFVLAGIFLGLGLFGYSAFRIMPFVVVAGVLVYFFHQKIASKRKETWLALGVTTLFAIILALPLIHFAIEFPQDISFRTVTRMTSAEVPLAQNVLAVFFSNTFNALTMPFWKDGSTWFISVTDRPALDVVSAALYFIGLVAVFARWIKRRNWQDLFLLVSIPIFMLPSILALAFPNENPSLSRAGGALIPIMIICAIGFQSLFASLWQKSSRVFGKVLVVILALGLVLISARQNYDLVFNQYKNSYANATWNTKQIGDVCKSFIDSVGYEDTCYVSGLAYWADTRLVAMAAGYPTRDFALWPKDYETSLADPRAKMFIVRSDQVDDLNKLKQLYPQGFETLHKSPIEGRDFIAFLVPPTTVAQ